MSDEVIIAPSKFHRDLYLSSYFSTNFPCQNLPGCVPTINLGAPKIIMTSGM